ncbi:SEFIR domain-containing protein [Pseudonocardia humida]|uniref:TIR domain-containing protein n=1 Tax=Pseudonocardia humida TaxID=2800819 RepID=A0ABT1A8F4_9PSEU|nr:SEFIR domain-containing protein [Pseudonocardia humida]MCO1659312.1 TIR domain-containing protein [Pseudonocardia humida]
MSDSGVAPCQVLISYAHEDEGHKNRVRRFCELLAEHDLDVRLDQFAAVQRQDWVRWTIAQIRAADRVLVVVSPTYRRRFERADDSGSGHGVQFEGLLIGEEVFRDPDSALRKFIPVLLPGNTRADIPTVLLPYSGTSYSVELTREGVAPLVELLSGTAGGATAVAAEHRARPARSAQPGRLAALHLTVRSEHPAVADDVVRAFLELRADAAGVEFDHDHVPSGAVATGSADHCAGILSRAARTIHAMLSGPHRAATTTVRIGAHIATSAPDAVATATRLSLDPVAVPLHAIPGARVVTVVSERFRDETAALTGLFPRRDSYRPLSTAEGNAWFAVAGRARAPEPPPADPGGTAATAPDDGPEPPPAHVVVGVNTGLINNGYLSGRDMTVSIVKNYGVR